MGFKIRILESVLRWASDHFLESEIINPLFYSMGIQAF